MTKMAKEHTDEDAERIIRVIVRGRVQGTRLVPYATREQIAAGALVGRQLELAWAADTYEAFFLEIQGSGRLRLLMGASSALAMMARTAAIMSPSAGC